MYLHSQYILRKEVVYINKLAFLQMQEYISALAEVCILLSAICMVTVAFTSGG